MKLLVMSAALLGLLATGVVPDVSAETLTTIADGTIIDSNGDGVFDSAVTSDLGLTVLSIPGNVVHRAIMEFDIGAIPANASITSVEFEFELTSFTGSSTGLNIVGYSGDGSVSLGDATTPAAVLGLFDAVALGLGQQSVELDSAFFQASLGMLDFVGLRLESDVFGTNIGLAASEFGGEAIPPRLRVSFVDLIDADGDGIGDAADNCLLVPNPLQDDTDGDQIGNFCDADLTNDCLVNFLDLNAMKAAFFSNAGSANWNPNADLDSTGIVNFLDLNIMKGQFFGPPGPSGIPNDCDELAL